MGQANHTMVSNTDTSCSPCHTGTDAANRMVAVQGEVMNSLSALKRRLESWATTKYGNSSFWDYTTLVTGGTAPTQSGVPIEVKRARYNYYYIVRSGDYGVHNAVYTRHLITVANTNLTNIAVPAAVPQTKSLQELAPYFKAEKARAMQMEMGSAPQ